MIRGSPLLNSSMFTFTRLASTPFQKLAMLLLEAYSLNLVQRALRRLGPLPGPFRKLRLKPEELKGKSLLIDPTDASHAIIFKEIFLDNIYQLSNLPFKPDLIIDCGGHIGLFTLLAQHHFPGTRALVFEPNKANLIYLKSQIEFNQLAVQVIPSAVSNFDGFAEFSAGCSCSGSIATAVDAEAAGETVPVANLCEVLKQEKTQQLLLKMDIEGGEEILLPAILPLLPRRTVLFFETHFGEPSWERHQSNLQNAGFTVSQTSKRDRFADGIAIST